LAQLGCFRIGVSRGEQETTSPATGVDVALRLTGVATRLSGTSSWNMVSTWLVAMS